LFRAINMRTSLMFAIFTCVLTSGALCGGSTTPASTGGGTSSNGTPAGSYTVTVNADTVGNAGNAPDAVLNIPLTVN